MKDKNINIRIPENLRVEFYHIAHKNAQNPSELVRRWIENYVREAKRMSDTYLVLNETAHGRRFWRTTFDPDLEKLTGSNGRTLAVHGPAFVGDDGYDSEDEAAEALADLAGIELDDPTTWE